MTDVDWCFVYGWWGLWLVICIWMGWKLSDWITWERPDD